MSSVNAVIMKMFVYTSIFMRDTILIVLCEQCGISNEQFWFVIIIKQILYSRMFVNGIHVKICMCIHFLEVEQDINNWFKTRNLLVENVDVWCYQCCK